VLARSAFHAFSDNIIAAPPAQAQAPSRVGEAVVVQKEVLRVSTEATSQVSVGDGLLRERNRAHRPRQRRAALMADSTNLSLGANASITLDRTVFDDEHRYRDIAVKMTSGAFRFVTGIRKRPPTRSRRRWRRSACAAHPRYPVGARQTTVVLQEGGSSVCTLTSQCIQLEKPGDTAIITSSANGRRSTSRSPTRRPGPSAAAVRHRPDCAA